MLIEDYFDFFAPDDIRLKGTRIGIETILFDYLFHDKTPEEIVKAYPSLTSEQVYATILYYLHNQQAVNDYMADWLEWGDRMREEQQRNPQPIVEKLRKLKAEKLAKQIDNAQVSYR
ncbi:MAG: DUF433 domain-containing protein [Thermosynechococcaceae cyanobacterium]